MKQRLGNNGSPPTGRNYCFVPGSGPALWRMPRTSCRKHSCVTGEISVISREIRRRSSLPRSGAQPSISPVATVGGQFVRICLMADWMKLRPISRHCLARGKNVGSKSNRPFAVYRLNNAKFSYLRSGRNSPLKKSARFSLFHPTPPRRATAMLSSPCAKN